MYINNKVINSHVRIYIAFIQWQFRVTDQRQWNTFHPNRQITTEDPNARPLRIRSGDDGSSGVATAAAERECEIQAERDGYILYINILYIIGSRFRFFLFFFYRTLFLVVIYFPYANNGISTSHCTGRFSILLSGSFHVFPFSYL